MKNHLSCVIALFALLLSLPIPTVNFEVSGYTEISTKFELNAVRNDLNGKYRLVEDIVFTESDFAEGGDFYNGGYGWIPIGEWKVGFMDDNSENSFKGIFDGNGHTVTGLRINNVRNCDTAVCAGLFGSVTDGEIKNLGMLDCKIQVPFNYDILLVNAGAVAGSLEGGRISNCYTDGNSRVIAETTSFCYVGGIVGNVEKGDVAYCRNAAEVLAESYYISSSGGIVGELANGDSTDYRSLNRCSNTGKISAHLYAYQDDYGTPRAVSGGIAGACSANGFEGCKGYIIENCCNSGEILASSDGENEEEAIAGGIAGRIANMQTLVCCYNVGEIEATAVNMMQYAGGIMGQTYIHIPSLILKTENCYYCNSAEKAVGDGTGTAVRCTKEQMTKAETFEGFDFENVWTIKADGDYGYPELLSMSSSQAGGVRPIVSLPFVAVITATVIIAVGAVIAAVAVSRRHRRSASRNLTAL